MSLPGPGGRQTIDQIMPSVAAAMGVSGFDNMLAFELSAIALATTALNRVAGVAWRLGGLQIDFAMPVLVGETVESRVEVLEIGAANVACAVRCTRADGAVVAEGGATLVPARPAPLPARD